MDVAFISNIFASGLDWTTESAPATVLPPGFASTTTFMPYWIRSRSLNTWAKSNPTPPGAKGCTIVGGRASGASWL
jgi:hypothetical protein